MLGVCTAPVSAAVIKIFLWFFIVFDLLPSVEKFLMNIHASRVPILSAAEKRSFSCGSKGLHF